MHSSTQKRSALPEFLRKGISIPLNTRTLLVCLFALAGLSACLYGLLNQQFSAQQHAQIEQFLHAKANAIQSNADSDAGNLLSPVYFYQGDLSTSKTTLHWPKGCQLLIKSKQNIQRFKCDGGLDVHALQTRINNGASDARLLTIWTIRDKPDAMAALSHEGIAILGLLGILISVLCSRWMSHSITKPLAEISSSVAHMSAGYYEYRLPKSAIREINQLAQSFNHMAFSLQERDKMIRRTAYKDQLTGLDNRAFLSIALQERTEQAREPLSIIIWGIDNLDTINEVLGHEVADQVLVKVARKASRICKENLVIARLEGNVFCMLVPRLLLENFQAAHSIKRLLQGSLRVKHYHLDIHSHAGIAHYPEHAQCPETLMRRAEIARQLAKKTRQPFILFEPRLEQRSAHRLELIAQLRKAINEQEFCLYFQPKLNLRTSSINQAEALLRWNHPVHGLIGPGGFIELAEQTGMIREITRLVLKQIYSIIDLCANQNIRLSVNLSAMDLEDDGLIQFIGQLHQAQPDASRHLMLEITESAAMRDPEQALNVLNQLAAMNFQIAVDDFGTGYSSLAYLKRFPVTELKIDRSLVQGADMDTDGQIILESTIEMGHIMGLLVTTEGVETQAEFELVKQLGADYIQGFWLSKPIPFEEFKLKHLVGNHGELIHQP